MAKEYSHEFTADKVAELSKEELEVVAGGGRLKRAAGLWGNRISD